MKKQKHTKEWHGSNAKTGMGDYYGVGVKNPVAKIRDSYMAPTRSKSLNKPPKSLA